MLDGLGDVRIVDPTTFFFGMTLRFSHFLNLAHDKTVFGGLRLLFSIFAIVFKVCQIGVGHFVLLGDSCEPAFVLD